MAAKAQHSGIPPMNAGPRLNSFWKGRRASDPEEHKLASEVENNQAATDMIRAQTKAVHEQIRRDNETHVVNLRQNSGDVDFNLHKNDLDRHLRDSTFSEEIDARRAGFTADTAEARARVREANAKGPAPATTPAAQPAPSAAAPSASTGRKKARRRTASRRKAATAAAAPAADEATPVSTPIKSTAAELQETRQEMTDGSWVKGPDDIPEPTSSMTPAKTPSENPLKHAAEGKVCRLPGCKGRRHTKEDGLGNTPYQPPTDDEAK